MAHHLATRPLALLLLGVTLATIRPAAAQVPDTPITVADNSLALPTERNQPIPGQTNPPPLSGPDAKTELWDRANLFGDMFGGRPFLADHGVQFGLTETSEVLGNPTGGRAQGVVYEGQTQVSLGIDLDRAIGLPGSIFNVSFFQIHGRGLSTNNIGNLSVVSNIEADRATRLFELFYQLSLFDGGVDVKIGQQSADLEFMTSLYGGLFINSGFGWPTLSAVDVPGGGSAYPLATPGIRLRARPSEATTLLLGVFNGSPAGLAVGDPQNRDPSGTNFGMNNGVFIAGELQYAINQAEGSAGLPGTYKIGATYNSNAFPNQVFLPQPQGPSSHRADWSLYVLADQLVYRPVDSHDGGAGVFARVITAPDNRNQVSLFIDGGVTYKGAFGRDNDTMGLAVNWARVSNTARAGDAAYAAAGNPAYPVRTAETVLELSYQATLAPWWTVQPDMQYVINPAGGIPNPNQPQKRLRDAAVFGLRSSITF